MPNTPRTSSSASAADDDRQYPNYFVAIPIHNAEIVNSVKQVQDRLVASDKQLVTALEPLESLHLTILVMHLDEKVCLHTARAGLDKSGQLIQEDPDQSELSLEFSNIGHFNKTVVIGKIKEGDALARLHRLADCVQDGFAAAGVPRFEVRKFNPHLTVAKLSRGMDGSWQRVQKINQSTLDDVSQMSLGKSTVTSLQLCPMGQPRTESGYYQVMHEIPLQFTSEK